MTDKNNKELSKFYEGFEKKAAPFEALRQAANKITPKAKVSAALVGSGAALYGGFKAVDKGFGDVPTPQREW